MVTIRLAAVTVTICFSSTAALGEAIHLTTIPSLGGESSCSLFAEFPTRTLVGGMMGGYGDKTPWRLGVNGQQYELQGVKFVVSGQTILEGTGNVSKVVITKGTNIRAAEVQGMTDRVSVKITFGGKTQTVTAVRFCGAF